MAEKKLIIGSRVSWKRVIWFVGLTYLVSFLLCGFVYREGKKLDPELPAIKQFTDIVRGKPEAVARYLEMHPEVRAEDLPKEVAGVKDVVVLKSLEEQVAVYVSQKHLAVQSFGAMMFFPALIAVLLRLVFRDGFRNSGFRFGKAKNYLYVLIFIVGFAVLGVILNALLYGKKPDWLLEHMAVGGLSLMGRSVTPFIFWTFQFLVIGLIANITFPIIAMLGEEYGWRPYLLQNLLPLGFWKANVITGVVWGLWHAPVILMGYNYGSFTLSGVFLFTLLCVLLGTVFNYMYVRGNSVILAAAAHGWFNGLIPSVILLTGFMGKEPLMAPMGLLGIAIMLVLVLIGYKITKGYDIRDYIEVKE
ncbi:MAG: CPBP family intramembrane metalloprotease [Candidatus Marinimicrobia bacterium]|nr:CPBP family intramembrane metalloprotease [Candidatus Neomarinimicrobiota bacterium]